jgi:hypothetical protein
MKMLDLSDTRDDALRQRAAWGAVLTTVSVLATLALACATPFAALAVIAVIFLPRREAFVLIGVNWLANQAIGFGLLHYPLTWSTVEGGINIGIAAMASVAASILVYRPLLKFGTAVAIIGTLVASFVVNEGALFVTAMGHFDGDFSAAITLSMFYLNAIALAALLALQVLATAIGLVVPRAQLSGRVARAA